MPLKSHLPYRNLIAIVVVFSLLMAMFLPLAHAEDAQLSAAKNAELPGTDAYSSRYTSAHWESANEMGTLLMNDTAGICLDIQGRGAGLRSVLLPYEGQTDCNALQIVLENRSACTELALQVTYTGRPQRFDLTLRLQAHSAQTVYYAYLDDVDQIEQLTLIFQGVSDGKICMYSFSRVSFYEQLPDEKRYGTIQECYYDTVSKNVVVTGRLRSDSVVDFSGGRIALYRLRMTQDTIDAVNGNIRALQTVKVSNRFTFTVPAPVFEERNCRYALILISAGGERVLMSEPCYPSHQTSDTGTTKLTPAYKGIYADQGAIATLTHPDAVIVDVYLDELVAKDETYVDSYAYENSYFFFDQIYRNYLESEILPHLQIGRQVYLRISVQANQAGYRLPYTVAAPDTDVQPQYLAISLNSEEAQKAYCAALQYLLELFSSQKTALAGIVLGHAIDNSLQYHYAGMISLQAYLQAVVNTVLHTQNILGGLFPEAILYLPVSDTKYPSYYSSYDLDGVYATAMLLDGVARMLEDVGQGAAFYPLLEIDTMPFDLTQQPWSTEPGDNTQPLQQTDLDMILMPDELMQPLLAYESVADTCSVIWKAPEECAEIPWTISYIYLYYIMQTPYVNTFFACLNSELLSDKLFDLISHIDTVYAAQVTKSSLPYFDLSSFDSLVTEKKASQAKQLYTVALTEETRGLYVGRYSYWNFAAAIGTLQWMQSFGCASLAADGGSSYGRALLAQMSAAPQGGEILYSFTNPEDFSLCDALAMTLAVEDQEGNYVPAKLYLTLYGEDERVEGSCLIQNGKMTTVTLSGVALDSVKACSAVSVRLEPIGNDEDQPLNLYIFNIEGLSRIWNDATLQLNILEQREIRNKVPQEIPEFGVYPILLVTALFVLVLLGAFWSLRASRQRRTY